MWISCGGHLSFLPNGQNDIMKRTARLLSLMNTQWRIHERGLGGLSPRLSFRPNWGPKGQKNVFETTPSPYLRVWMTMPPSPSPSPLICRSGSATKTDSVEMLLKWITFNFFERLDHWTFITKHVFCHLLICMIRKNNVLFELTLCCLVFLFFVLYWKKLIVKSFLFSSWWWRALAWCSKS